MSRPKLEKTRLAVDVPPTVKERIEEIRVMTEADSMAEVVRRALAVYESLIAEGRTVELASGLRINLY